MFGIVVAGRLVQTDFKQVDSSRFVFDLANPEKINYFTVFLTGQQPFPENYGATVYYMGPQSGNITWKLLGYVSNDKPSAIFKLRVGNSGQLKDDEMADASNSGMDAPPALEYNQVAELGISVEPLDSVMYQVEQNELSAMPASAPNSSGVDSLSLVKSPSASRSLNVSSLPSLAQALLENFITHVESFSVGVLPPGVALLSLVQTPDVEQLYIPLKAVTEWYSKISNKLKYNPSGDFLRNTGA